MSTARDESQATLNALPTILKYLSGLAKSSDGGLQDIAVQEYSSLLFSRVSREQFWEQRSDTLTPLVKILQAAAGIGSGESSSASLWSGNVSTRSDSLGGGVGLQLLYHVLLVVWQISFESEVIGDDLDESVTTVPVARRCRVNETDELPPVNTILCYSTRTYCDCRPRKRRHA